MPTNVTAEPTAPTSHSQAEKGFALTPVQLGLIGTGIVLVVCVLLWGPAAAFHIGFQQLVTSGDVAAHSGGLLSATGQPLDASAAGAAEAGVAWHQVPIEGVLVTLPPGAIETIEREKSTLTVVYESGILYVDTFPAGLVRAVYLEELERVAGSRDRLPEWFRAGDETGALHRITNTTPGDYSFGMSTDERTHYAAAICSKLRLWEFQSVEDIVLLDGPDAGGVLMHAEEGRSKVIVCAPDATVVVTLRGVTWDGGTERWLDVGPFDAELEAAWKKRCAERYPADHPVRRLAD